MNLFERKTFTSSAGRTLHYKIECDALTEQDIATLAFIVSQRMPFHEVIGIERGGTRLREALMPLAQRDSRLRLIVDDVLTTGRSMEQARGLFKRTDEVAGVVIFARGRDVPRWVYPIFRMDFFAD